MWGPPLSVCRERVWARADSDTLTLVPFTETLSLKIKIHTVQHIRWYLTSGSTLGYTIRCFFAQAQEAGIEL